MAETKEIKMGKRNMAAMGKRPKIDNLPQIAGRLFKRILSKYWFHCLLVIACIGINAYVNIRYQLFTKELIDVYIVPYLDQANPDFSLLAARIMQMIGIFVLGIICNYGRWQRKGSNGRISSDVTSYGKKI